MLVATDVLLMHLRLRDVAASAAVVVAVQLLRLQYGGPQWSVPPCEHEGPHT